MPKIVSKNEDPSLSEFLAESLKDNQNYRITDYGDIGQSVPVICRKKPYSWIYEWIYNDPVASIHTDTIVLKDASLLPLLEELTTLYEEKYKREVTIKII